MLPKAWYLGGRMKLFKKDYYEKLLGISSKTPASIEDYYSQIRDAQAKIEEIRSKCDHSTHKVVMYSWRPGAMQPSRVCETCDKYLEAATEEESKEIWDKFHGHVPNGGEHE